MDCRAFEAWLDDGRPAADGAAAAAHRDGCAACRELAAQVDDLERALASRGPDPGDAFTAAVMAKLPAVRREVVPAVEPELLMPWWTQLVREPEAALGLLLGAVYAGTAPWLGPRLLAAWPAITTGAVPAPADLGLSPLALAVFVLPVLGTGSWLLYRAASNAFGRMGAAS